MHHQGSETFLNTGGDPNELVDIIERVGKREVVLYN
jgi:hypothetical protein